MYSTLLNVDTRYGDAACPTRVCSKLTLLSREFLFRRGGGGQGNTGVKLFSTNKLSGSQGAKDRG